MEVIIGDYRGFVAINQKYAMGVHEWGRVWETLEDRIEKWRP